MATKICFKCNIEKSIDEFYKHKKMADGHLGKCKNCTKTDSKNQLEIKTSTPEGLEKERERQRDKYKRLGYKDKQKEWDKDRGWKNTSIFKNLSRDFKVPKGFELHHWNYNTKYLKDVSIIKTKQHKIAHTHLVFDKELLFFKTKNGVLLDTKSKHISYLVNQGVEF